jgi:hypothetical protein
MAASNQLLSQQKLKQVDNRLYVCYAKLLQAASASNTNNISNIRNNSKNSHTNNTQSSILSKISAFSVAFTLRFNEAENREAESKTMAYHSLVVYDCASKQIAAAS